MAGAVVCLVGSLWCGAVLAGDKNGHPIDLTQPAAAATVGRIVDQAVVNIGRRYNLNDRQLEETDRIMKKNVNDFLKKHEDEIWPALRELLANNLKAPDDVADLKRLGRSARKLAKLAHKAVKEGNAEWRKILTDEQKKTHDYDLAELEKSFAQMDQNFAEWTEGRAPDGPIFGNDPRLAQKRRIGPPTPTRPDEGLPGLKSKIFELTVFDTFVDAFIKDYGLDAAQIDSARSILKETKTNARNFQDTKKADFARIEEARNKAIAARDRKEQAKLDAERKKLLEPVYSLFAQMESRLRGLLRTAQVQRHQDKAKTAPSAEPKVVKKNPAPKKKKKPAAAAAGEKKVDAGT